MTEYYNIFSHTSRLVNDDNLEDFEDARRHCFVPARRYIVETSGRAYDGSLGSDLTSYDSLDEFIADLEVGEGMIGHGETHSVYMRNVYGEYVEAFTID